MSSFQSSLSDMQGRLFELSVQKRLASEAFVKAFMLSDIAKKLDSEFDHLQWAGKEYVLECMLDECKGKLTTSGEVYDREIMYWMGYTYRKWHFYLNKSSKEIYKVANARRMRTVYYPYHTLSTEMAICRLEECNNGSSIQP